MSARLPSRLPAHRRVRTALPAALAVTLTCGFLTSPAQAATAPASSVASTATIASSTTPATTPVSAARSMQLAISSVLTSSARSVYLRAGLSGYVVDYGTGTALWSYNAAKTRMPASNQKVLTAYTAVRSMDTESRLQTRALQSQANPGNVYLRGGGDPTLTGTRLKALAAQTASALQAQGRSSVNLYLDASVFPAPTSATGWKASYLAGEVQRVRGLTLAGYRGTDGTLAAGSAFRTYLKGYGVTVGDFGTGAAPAARDELGATSSATVASIIGAMLRDSNNDYAEYLLRLSALDAGRYPTWANSLAHQRAVLTSNRIPLTGYAAYDGSGLSRSNRMPARTLVSVISAMYTRPADRAVVFAPQAMPRAGQTGTLASRYRKAPQSCAAGRVIAKTGTLNDVVALAGIAKGVDGRTRVFAFLENGNTNTTAVRNAVDALAATTVGCRL